MSRQRIPPVATVVNGHTFTVDTRYVLKDSRILGKGSFGVVCTAYDSVRKVDLAVKRIRPFANDDWDARHTLREIRLLKLLGPHPNIISLYELSLFEPKTELYMMMELMDCDLHRVIQSKQALTEKHHKCFLLQMLEGIKAMHAIGVFHRDLKPGNLLVSKDCQLRITDFGLARFMDENTRQGQNEANPMTEYVVTRWYRCPELLLAPNRPYSEAIDLWSIGCIFAELLRRKPLFPGKSHTNQVQLIFEALGYSSPQDLGFPISAEATAFLDKRCKYRKQPLQKFVPDASDGAVRLLGSLLALNPSVRPSAAQALRHPFLKDAEVLNDYSPIYLQRPQPDFFEFEQAKFSVPSLKRLIEKEVAISAADAYRYAPSDYGEEHSPSSGTDCSPVKLPAEQNKAAAAAAAAAALAMNQQEQLQQREQAVDSDAASVASSQSQYAMRGAEGVTGAGGTGTSTSRGGGGGGRPRNYSSVTGSAGGMAGVAESESEGPASQIPTQQRQQRIPSGGGGGNNPFRSALPGRQQQSRSAASGDEGASQAGSGKAVRGTAQAAQGQGRPKSSSDTMGDVGAQAAAYRNLLMNSRSSADVTAAVADRADPKEEGEGERGAQGEVSYIVEDSGFDPVPLDALPPSGNILTAVRNEIAPASSMQSSQLPPGKPSRSKPPKTPSPKKMGAVAQKDLNHKRRFLLQQQQQQEQHQGIMVGDVGGGVGTAGSNDSSKSDRSGKGSKGGSGGVGNKSLLARMKMQSERNTTTYSRLQQQGQGQRGGGGAAVVVRAQQIGGSTGTNTRTGASGAAGIRTGAASGAGGGSRFGRLVPGMKVPFPSLTSRQAAAADRTNSINNAAAVASRQVGGETAASSAGGEYLGSSSHDQLDGVGGGGGGGMRSSAMMRQGGSNVINR